MMLEYQFTALQKDLDDISNRLKERYFPEGRPIEDNPDRAVDVSANNCTGESWTFQIIELPF